MQLKLLSWDACLILREKIDLLIQFCSQKDDDVQQTWLKPKHIEEKK